MGSSDSGTGVVVDCSVGTIVWVRRRNGSWWPGKVVGPDELSASHLMSPRSGTPVKLLGREDASVDWYNLEKSKRVKAFRCGEFDDCIDRAEASLGIPPKKRDKYARREDAILHALELEKQLLEKKYGKVSSSSNKESIKLSDGVKKVLATSSEIMVTGNGKHVNPKSDDDNSDALPRMRGLQDFGLKIAPSKRKVSSAAALNGSQKLMSDDCAYVSPNGDQRRENMILANSRSSLDKMKRSDEGLFEECLAKRRDRRRPLVQVLESSAKLQVPHPLYLTAKSGDCSEDTEILHDQMEVSVSESEENKSSHPVAPSEKNISGSTEDTETDSSETDSVESDTDSDDTMDAFSDDDAPIEFIPKSLGRSETHGEHGRMSSEEPDDVPLASGMANFYHNIPDSTSMGVSEWQMKGKRNNRGLAKRYLKVSESYGLDEPDLIENNYRTQMAGYGSRGFDGVNRNIIDWDELAWNNQPTSRGGYWRDPPEYFDHGRRFGGRMKTMLIDVDLKVQSSYQREHVPMICLMSKLNGNAIVGHPIQVETLEDGLSETLIAVADDFGPEVSDYDTALPPVWRTARRTASSRVPRPQIRKGLSHQPQMDRKFFRKPPKKMSLSSSPKIRTLSSIATQQKHSSDYSKHVSNGYQLDGLIKSESGPTTVACIPVKLVFSRLYEELVGRHQ